MASNALRIGLQVFFGILIIGLSYVLYRSITDPYKVIEEQERLTSLTRARMDQIRQVAIAFESQYERFPSTLDSLVLFAKTDSLFLTKRDSIFVGGFSADSLLRSPRSGNMFEWASNDTSRVKTYLLKDPDSGDRIGTLMSDVTLLNAANWE